MQDVGAAAAEAFGQQSGEYTVEVIVGDAVIENPVRWVIGSVALSFAKQPSASPSVYTAVLPEITHVFRQPE